MKERILGVDATDTDNGGGKAQTGFFPSIGRSAALGEDIFGGGGAREQVDDGHSGESALFTDLGRIDRLAGSEERRERVEGLEVLCGVGTPELKVAKDEAKGLGIDAEAEAIGEASTCGRCDAFDDKGDLPVARARAKSECCEKNKQKGGECFAIEKGRECFAIVSGERDDHVLAVWWEAFVGLV